MQIKYDFFSKRLGFRVWQESDVIKYAEMSSDPEVMKFFPKVFWLDKQSARKSINGFMDHYHKYGFTYFAVDLLSTQEFIGFIGLKHISYEVFFTPTIDIGWRLFKSHWGKGYASEGAKRALDWFFENFDEDSVVSMTPVLNKASEKVMIKIGMKKIDTFEHPLVAIGHPLSKHVLYEIKK